MLQLYQELLEYVFKIQYFKINLFLTSEIFIKRSVGLPDVHSGYGFAIGNVAAFDMSDPEAVVSPGGVGFDINCGVRLLRTNLSEKEILPVKEQLAQYLKVYF